MGVNWLSLENIDDNHVDEKLMYQYSYATRWWSSMTFFSPTAQRRSFAFYNGGKCAAWPTATSPSICVPLTAKLKVRLRPITCVLCAYRVQVEKRLVMLSLRRHSSNGFHIFIFCQVEMGEGGDHRGTCVGRGEFRGETKRKVIMSRGTKTIFNFYSQETSHKTNCVLHLLWQCCLIFNYG